MALIGTLEGRDNALPEFPARVHSVDGLPYLLVERLGDGVVSIRRHKGARRKLDPYWRMWAYTQIKRLDPERFDLSIELQRSSIMVKSRQPVEAWFWPLTQTLSAIQMVPHAPMDKLIKDRPSINGVEWTFTDDASLLRTIIKGLRLPADATYNFYVQLTASGFQLMRRHKGRYHGGMRQREVRQLVEWQVATAYAKLQQGAELRAAV